ncbi:MAG: nitronate monooxygenase [Burkholderiaceae bacterium]|jgi:NAD(P)H-dependent flavin oxidoreductase YrpB (nitropropane dioxygenase family)|nr:nitronate monooxygenase [Burkholderiaceae bacterium]
MLHTALCKRIGIAHPIFCAGMGTTAGPELAAAVSNAGGLGVLGTASLSAKVVRQRIAALRGLTTLPFGINVVLEIARRGQIDVCLEEKVPVLVLFWGEVAPYVADARNQGVMLIAQVGSVAEARAAADADVHAIMVQGVEAGGHVRGTTPLSILLPAVVEAVGSVPVIAAGGIATGAGVVSALALGAQAVSIGTRFVASTEANAAPAYKQRIVRARADDTVLTELFDVGYPAAPHRVLRNRAFDDWQAAASPASGQRPGEGELIGTMQSGGAQVDVPRYSAYIPEAQLTADVEHMALYAGQSCELVHDIKPAGQIVHDLVREAGEVMARLAADGAAQQGLSGTK